ncbi:hypothetical protein ABIB25_001062 [Nakamurella sp. UYEF19]|uniref:ANTAR domain-containing protein n=1 Tax=Nakamurella sp. UYEF19 TaxID=1756392 RepID=UPI0033939CE8
MQTPSGVVGAMNIYAQARDVFDARAEQLGQVCAVPAAITVHNAQILDQTGRLSRNLQAALASRPVIDQAIGIPRSRTGASTDDAFERLRSISQTEHLKLVVVVATRIVEQAVLRAPGRPLVDANPVAGQRICPAGAPHLLRLAPPRVPQPGRPGPPVHELPGQVLLERPPLPADATGGPGGARLLADGRTVDQAIGVLIARGHHPDDAMAVLGSDAAVREESIIAAADRLLASPAPATDGSS